MTTPWKHRSSHYDIPKNHFQNVSIQNSKSNRTVNLCPPFVVVSYVHQPIQKVHRMNYKLKTRAFSDIHRLFRAQQSFCSFCLNDWRNLGTNEIRDFRSTLNFFSCTLERCGEM